MILVPHHILDSPLLMYCTLPHEVPIRRCDTIQVPSVLPHTFSAASHIGAWTAVLPRSPDVHAQVARNPRMGFNVLPFMEFGY